MARGPSQPVSRSRLQRAARRGALRAMRPFTAYQSDLNQAVSSSLEIVLGELDRVAEREVLSDVALERRVRLLEGLHRLPSVLDARGKLVDELSVRVAEAEHAVRVSRYQTDRGVYLALDRLRERHASVAEAPSQARGGPLTPFELRVFSQNGEDGLIAEILARIGTGAGHPFFVEFGIESGREGNCVSLADAFAWRGLFIEGDERWHRELEQKYRGNGGVATLQAMVTPYNSSELYVTPGVPL